MIDRCEEDRSDEVSGRKETGEGTTGPSVRPACAVLRCVYPFMRDDTFVSVALLYCTPPPPPPPSISYY